ncbi:MAG: response regulator [Sulfurimonas sp.]|uniref:response regulator n=1 Tax=Sulfurimonas sp. TaxID=2022749 RepID=UPI00261A9C4F|nr:response regulator [Sulfurimonas sp.]MCW8895307.1 response regulator [Sulfurimonas sp.]MCW8954575.1 response regulator [Sulfurimonas sp.]MCW9067325.1 response regulator [Sulfurimonas sp.]
MKILIIENEIYLAQSIATKLGELGHVCEMCTSTRDAIKSNNYDVVLLSTNINGQDFNPVIETFKKSIIILMVSYISNDTVSKPLSAGAKDYILKPFMIEELIRKINHYQDYEKLKKRNGAYEKYLTHTFSTLTGDHNFDNLELPLFISSPYQKHADSFAFEYAKEKNLPLHFITLSDPKAMNEIELITENSIIYIIDYQLLKKNDKKAFYALTKGKKVIIASTDKIEDEEYKILEIKSENNIFDQGEILPIEDYVKFIVLNYQHKFPDTELSKKLGISRKSLWEKRKKYDIVKKK